MCRRHTLICRASRLISPAQARPPIPALYLRGCARQLAPGRDLPGAREDFEAALAAGASGGAGAQVRARPVHVSRATKRHMSSRLIMPGLVMSGLGMSGRKPLSYRRSRWHRLIALVIPLLTAGAGGALRRAGAAEGTRRVG